jgi:hypothetical protein
MEKKRIVVEIASVLVAEIDQLVSRQPRHIGKLRRDRLAEACLQLDPDEERALAEEGLGSAYLPSEEY